MKATQRLYLTADRKTLVAAGDKRGRFLYCSPGDEIPQSAVDRFKLVDGGLKGRGAKEDKGGENKERPGGGDKGGAGDGAPQPDDLTKISGVGAKTAAALAQAGLTTLANIAAVDPANPPAVEGLSPAFDWAKVQKAARAALSGA